MVEPGGDDRPWELLRLLRARHVHRQLDLPPLAFLFFSFDVALIDIDPRLTPHAIHVHRCGKPVAAVFVYTRVLRWMIEKSRLGKELRSADEDGCSLWRLPRMLA